MKSLYSLLVLATLLSLTACGSDSLQEQLESETWVVVSGSLSGCDEPSENQSAGFNVDPCTAASSSECEYQSFSFANGVATVTTITSDGDAEPVETDVQPGTYTVDDNDNLTLCIRSECLTGPASVDDGTATLSFAGLDDGCTLTYNLRAQ